MKLINAFEDFGAGAPDANGVVTIPAGEYQITAPIAFPADVDAGAVTISAADSRACIDMPRGASAIRGLTFEHQSRSDK